MYHAEATERPITLIRDRGMYTQVVIRWRHDFETYHQATINQWAGQRCEVYIATSGVSEMFSADTIKEAYRLAARAVRLMHYRCCVPVEMLHEAFWKPSQLTITIIRKELEGSRNDR